MLSVPYQGNPWWVMIGLCSLLMMFYILLNARRRHNAGLSVDVRGTISGCIIALFFVAMAILQVLSHQ
jgi:hypothetical protein